MTDHPDRPSLLRRIRKRLARLRHQMRFSTSVRHLHGARHRVAAADEVVLVALVRDGAYYLEPFFEHYRRLGVAHFVFFDNGSSDDTLARLRQQPGVVILQSKLPWGQFENDFRNYAAKRYARNRWCLIVDMDELFDFEGSTSIGLAGLTRYLADHGYSGLMAQMLEMVPKAPLRSLADLPYEMVLQQFCYCDISTVSAYDYHSEDSGLAYFLRQNIPPAHAPQILFGGLRGKVFGENCCLSKHPLIFVGPDVAPAVHPHASCGLRLAPMSALIKHYKFANDALARDHASVEQGAIGHGEDRQRLMVLRENPDLSLWSASAQRFPGIAALQEQGFLLRDPDFATAIGQSAEAPQSAHKGAK